MPDEEPSRGDGGHGFCQDLEFAVVADDTRGSLAVTRGDVDGAAWCGLEDERAGEVLRHEREVAGTSRQACEPGAVARGIEVLVGEEAEHEERLGRGRGRERSIRAIHRPSDAATGEERRTDKQNAEDRERPRGETGMAWHG